jgi:hypothetical protein
VHGDRLPQAERRELRLRDVGAQLQRVECRDAEERLAGGHQLARPDVGREHGARDRALDAALAQPLLDLRETGVRGGDLLRGRLALRRGRRALRAQHAHVALRLVQLLGGGRPLGGESLRAA